MFKYDAFISYRHVHPDAATAREIQRLVESFTVSKAVPGVTKRKGFRVFRDRDELASGELGEAIETALESSEFLIVLCSRRTPASPWCRREIEHFRKVRDSDHIIAVLIEGEPDEAFPPELKEVTKFVRRKDGTYEERRGEFLAADLRPDEVRLPDFPGYERVEQDSATLKRMTKKVFSILRGTEIYRIMATIVNVSYGDITQRQRERRMRRIVASASAVALILAVFGTVVTALWIRSMRSEEAARERSAAVTMNLASNAIADGDRILGIMYSRVAMESADPSMGGYDKLEGQYYDNLANAVLYEDYTSLTEIKTRSGVVSFGQNEPGDEVVTAGEGRSIAVWDARNGRKLRDIALPSKPTVVGNSSDRSLYYAIGRNNELSFVPTDGSRVATVRTGVTGDALGAEVWKDHAMLMTNTDDGLTIVGIDLTTGRRSFAMDSTGSKIAQVRRSPDGGEFAVSYRDGGAARFDAKTGRLIAWIVEPERDALAGEWTYGRVLAYSPAGNALVYYSGQQLHRVDLASGSSGVATLGQTSTAGSLYLDPNGDVVYFVPETQGIPLRYDFRNSRERGIAGDLAREYLTGAISAKGDVFAAVSRDNVVSFWTGIDALQPDALPRVSGETKHLRANVRRISMSADGQRAFALGSDASLTIIHVKGTDSAMSGSGAPQTRSNDGKVAYSTSAFSGHVKKLGTKEETKTIGSWIRPWATVSNDGQLITAIRRGTKFPSVYDVAGGTILYAPEAVVRTAPNTEQPLIVFGTGHDVVYASSDGTVVRFDQTGRLGDYGGKGRSPVIAVRASPDGSVVSVSRENGTFDVYGVESYRRLASGRGEVLSVVGRKGRLERLLALDRGEAVRMDGGGSTLTRARIPTEFDGQLAPSSIREGSLDGNRILVGGKASELVVLDAFSGSVLRTIQTNTVSLGAFFTSTGLVYGHKSGSSTTGYREMELLDPKKLDGMADRVVGRRRLTPEEEGAIGR